MLILLVIVFGGMFLAWWIMAQWAPREGYGSRTLADLADDEQTGEAGDYSWDCMHSHHRFCDGCDCGCHNDKAFHSSMMTVCFEYAAGNHRRCLARSLGRSTCECPC